MHSRTFINSRGGERIAVGRPVTLRIGWRGGLTAQAFLVDLSEQGVRLLSNFPLRLRQEIEVIVEEGADEGKLYRVTWARESEIGRVKYEAGLELITRPNSEADT